LVHEYGVALPLHAEYGTDPNVFYVPPLSPPRLDEEGRIIEEEPRIPAEYLRHLFGKGVDEVLAKLRAEIAKKQRGKNSELLDTLIVYSWPKDIFPDFIQDPADLT
jgi:nitrate reductase beta subunit